MDSVKDLSCCARLSACVAASSCLFMAHALVFSHKYGGDLIAHFLRECRITVRHFDDESWELRAVRFGHRLNRSHGDFLTQAIHQCVLRSLLSSFFLVEAELVDNRFEPGAAQNLLLQRS